MTDPPISRASILLLSLEKVYYTTAVLELRKLLKARVSPLVT
jgi:hypothetical protein